MFDGPSPRKLVFANSTSSSDLIGFPVLVTLTPANIDYSRVPDPLLNLRFEDVETSTDLPYDVDHWDPTGTSAVWVRVPQINSGSDHDFIYMHFGPSERGNYDPADVWTEYELVCHFDPTMRDATGRGRTGTSTGTAGAGIVAEAARFTSPNDAVGFSNSGSLLDGWSEFSIELWVRHEYTMSFGGEPRILDKDGSGIRLGRLLDQPPRFQTDIEIGLDTAFPQVALSSGEWGYVVYSYDAATLRVFGDGTQAASFARSGSLPSDNSQIVVGGTSNPMRGMIDELRIASTARSADWVRAQHLSMRGQFVTFVDPP